MHRKIKLIFKNFFSWTSILGKFFLMPADMGCSLGVGLMHQLCHTIATEITFRKEWPLHAPSIFQFYHFSSVQNSNNSLLECHYSVQVYSLDLMLVGSNAGSEGLAGKVKRGSSLTVWLGPSSDSAEAESTGIESSAETIRNPSPWAVFVWLVLFCSEWLFSSANTHLYPSSH